MTEARVPRLPIDEAKAAADQAGVPDYMAELSIFQVLLNHPALARAINDLLATMLWHGKLDRRLRERGRHGQAAEAGAHDLRVPTAHHAAQIEHRVGLDHPLGQQFQDLLLGRLGEHGAYRIREVDVDEWITAHRPDAVAVERVFATAKRRILLRSLMTAIVIFLIFSGVVGVLWIGARDVAAVVGVRVAADTMSLVLA